MIRTQGNIDPVYFTFSTKNYATFAQRFHCANYSGMICYRYQRSIVGIVGQFELDNPINCDEGRVCLCSTYIRVWVISASLA